MTHPTEGYRAPPPTTEARTHMPDLRADLRNEILGELAKLQRIIKGRTLGADVCLDRDEAQALAVSLQSWAGRV